MLLEPKLQPGIHIISVTMNICITRWPQFVSQVSNLSLGGKTIMNTVYHHCQDLVAAFEM